MEDWIGLTHDCGWRQEFDVRKIKEHLKKEKETAIFRKDTADNVFILSCGKCGERWQGIGKECIYRVCEDHMGEKRHWWIEAWKKLGMGEIKEKVDMETGEKLWKI
jgi:hypothetical protein